MVRVATVIAFAASLSLPGCYYSSTDLVGRNARVINAIDNILVTPQGSAYYIQGTGQQVQACYLQEKKHMTTCQVAATIKLERTAQGNYIVQAKDHSRYYYGLWFRSEQTQAARVGRQCFVWLGENYMGSLTPGYVLPGPNMQMKVRLAQMAQVVAPGALIDRASLDALVALHERELAPLTADEVTCISERVMLEPTRMQIAGDNRHLRDIE